MGIKRETEASFMSAVIEYARLTGWRVHHETDSRKSPAGLPDLICVRAGVIVWAELKTETGRLRPAQEEWLTALRAVSERAPGAVRVHLWRPSDWPEIQRVLGDRG